ncbi:hypothetical protein [Kribbella sp. NPDC023855]|uniref:hypothetical protein n=1 Tax=Kribbella sp. NPDC023855 TaxID=3154698 RepID=UPI003406991E
MRPTPTSSRPDSRSRLTDSSWAVPAAETNRLLSSRTPTYTFEFARKAPWYAGLPEPVWSAGSHHLSDVAYFFDSSVSR